MKEQNLEQEAASRNNTWPRPATLHTKVEAKQKLYEEVLAVPPEKKQQKTHSFSNMHNKVDCTYCG